MRHGAPICRRAYLPGLGREVAPDKMVVARRTNEVSLAPGTRSGPSGACKCVMRARLAHCAPRAPPVAIIRAPPGCRQPGPANQCFWSRAYRRNNAQPNGTSVSCGRGPQFSRRHPSTSLPIIGAQVAPAHGWPGSLWQTLFVEMARMDARCRCMSNSIWTLVAGHRKCPRVHYYRPRLSIKSASLMRANKPVWRACSRRQLSHEGYWRR